MHPKTIYTPKHRGVSLAENRQGLEAIKKDRGGKIWRDENPNVKPNNGKMKKNLFGIASVFVLLVIASAYGESPEAKKISIGSQMPQIKISNEQNTVELGRNTSERFTLITFWESLDAESRIACSKYDNFIKTNDEAKEKIDFIAINFDKSDILRQQIIDVDNLSEASQFTLDNNTAIVLRSSFSLDRGMGSVLVNPDGTVATFNPTVEQLKTVMKS